MINLIARVAVLILLVLLAAPMVLAQAPGPQAKPPNNPENQAKDTGADKAKANEGKSDAPSTKKDSASKLQTGEAGPLGQSSPNSNAATGDPNSGKVDGATAPPADSASLSILEILLLGIAVLLLLGLHGLHLFTASRLKADVAQLQNYVQRMHREMQNVAQRPPAPTPTSAPAPTASANVDGLSAQLSQQHVRLKQLAAQSEELSQRVAMSEQTTKNTATAIALGAQLAGETRLQQAASRAASELADVDRAAAARVVERYREIFGANLNRVKPLMQELAALNNHLQHRTDLPAEFINRMRALEQELGQFETWYAEASTNLAALRRDSMAERVKAFRSMEYRLTEELNFGSISIVDYVRQHRALLDQHFPAGEATGAALRLPAEQEAGLKKTLDAAPDYLMDWFDRLFQLQAQVADSQAAVDAQTVNGLTYIQQVAKEALGKFDIQPEEIQPGRTSFDNRLYEAALITPSAQYPANTVIGVQQCGFRRMSNGEVLRRPKVVVAGVGVGS